MKPVFSWTFISITITWLLITFCGFGKCSNMQRKFFKARTADLTHYKMIPFGEQIFVTKREVCQVLCSVNCTGFAWSLSTNRCQLVQDRGYSQGGELEAAHFFDLYIAETKDDSLTCKPVRVPVSELHTYIDSSCK